MYRLRPATGLLRQASALSSAPSRGLLSVAASASSPSRYSPSRLSPSPSARGALAACTACSAAVVVARSAASHAHADAGVAADVAGVGGGLVDMEVGAGVGKFSPPGKPMKKSDMKITLYQYDVCPFCNKVRAYLDFHGIPYTVVEVDPFGKKELQQFSKDYRKVPIAVINEQQVNGSGEIIAAARDSVYGKQDLSSADVKREQEWTDWVDDVLIHLISPNIYRTTGESLQAFEYIADNAKFTTWQRMSIRYSGAAAMYFVGKKIKKKYNIGEPRGAIYEAVDLWTAAVREGGGDFLGGREPGTADLAMFGVLRAIEKFDTYSDILENCEGFEEWFEKTRKAVGETCIVERL